jgi:hypothetical protein
MAATTRGGPSRVLDERPIWWLSSKRTSGRSIAEVVDPSILLADYQAKVERLIPAGERGPGTAAHDFCVENSLTFLSFCCQLRAEINPSFCL